MKNKQTKKSNITDSFSGSPVPLRRWLARGCTDALPLRHQGLLAVPCHWGWFWSRQKPPVGGGSTTGGRARRLYLVLDSVVQVGPASCGPELGAQEGPEYWDSAEEELTAAQATARIIAGEDGLRGLIQGLVWGTRR